MELQAIIGQLYLVDGAVQDTTAVPGMLAQSAPGRAARGREKDTLFIHLTLSGDPAETAVLAQDVLDSISRNYYQAKGSVTAALRQAIIKVNQNLLRRNMSGRDTLCEGAVTCAVLRNGELYTVQAGESFAVLGRNFGLERMPPQPPARVTPLGRMAGIDIRFYHHRLEPGDVALLADPSSASLPTQTLSAALAGVEAEVGIEALQEALADGSARLLLVEFSDEAPPDLPDISHPQRPSRRMTTAPNPLAVVPPPPPRRESAVLPMTTPEERIPQPERPHRPRTDHARTNRTLHMETSARRATSRAAMGLSRLTGWLAQVLTRIRPSRPTGQEATPPRTWALPALLALLIPVLVVIVATGVYFQRGRVRRFAEIKIEMGQNLAAAEAAAGDETAVRTALNAVVTLADEADTIRPGDAEVNRLRGEAIADLDRLDGITRLSSRALYEYEAGTVLTAVILREGFNGDIYTLDATNNVVYLHETDENYLTLLSPDPQQLLFSGQSVRGRTVRNLVDIMWRPRGTAVNREGLVMLDTVGALYSYFPNYADYRAVQLDLASEWRLPVTMSSFQERLYILDVGRGLIWKYFPDGEGFVLRDGEQQIFFNDDPDLTRAVDIVIYSGDGSLAVLYGDGRFRYYDTASGRVLWDETDLLQNGLESPMVRPTKVELVGQGLNTKLYIADPGSGRILQVSRSGTVLTQFRATAPDGNELFTRAADFAVAERPLRIFIASGNTLYVATEE